jgi:hypothetical protein
MPWFRRFYGDRVIISMKNRMTVNHSCLRSHLGRIDIVESPMCVSSWDYETIDQVLWHCGVARDLTPKGRNFGSICCKLTQSGNTNQRDTVGVLQGAVLSLGAAT